MDMIERLADAIDNAEMGYSLRLTSLIDGVSTYTLTYSDGEVYLFEYADDAHEHIQQRRRKMQATAVLKALREPTSEMIAAAWDLLDVEKKRAGIARLGPGIGAADIYRVMIDTALAGEGKGE